MAPEYTAATETPALLKEAPALGELEEVQLIQEFETFEGNDNLNDIIQEWNKPSAMPSITSKSVSIESSEVSILTRITDTTVTFSEFDDSPCLLAAQESNSQIFNNPTNNFSHIQDPGLDYFMEEVPTDDLKGWDLYKEECHKYSMPRLTPLRDVVINRNTKLDFKNYCPKTIGICMACETIFLGNFPVEHIDLSNSQFSTSGCITLNEVLETSKTLESLNLSNCKIAFKGVQTLESGLDIMQCLSYLNLSKCNLGDSGGVIVVRAMTSNDTVKTLNLSHNKLHSQTGKALRDMLIRNDKVNDLDLGWNLLNPIIDCLKPFLEGLAYNTGVQRLILCWNGIASTEELGEYFLKYFVKNASVQYLDLENNCFTENLGELAEALRRMKGLEKVKLGGNPLTYKDIDDILTAFSKKTQMQHLDLGKYRWLSKEQTNLITTKIKRVNRKLKITFQGTLLSKPLKLVDFKEILVDRMKFIGNKHKNVNKRKNFGHLFLTFLDEQFTKCEVDILVSKFKEFCSKLDDQLCAQIADEWKDPKTLLVDVESMALFYLKRYPTNLPEKVVNENLPKKQSKIKAQQTNTKQTNKKK